MNTTHISRRRFAKDLTASALLLPFARPSLAASDTVLDSPLGKLRGARQGTTVAFKGIPYARAPQGPSRFRAPQSLAPWRGVRDALRYGPPSLQNNRDEAAWVDPKPGSEDCLYLNVWTTDPSANAKKPVMVWFHGGGFSSGSGGLDLYDGATLAATGNVVVVTVNHRLNIFGYLWLGDLLPDYAHDGTPGQQDLVASLRWVQQNIAVFGGDPTNVTIFGESGGGGKVGSLLATPSARGLFHKAIIESGSQTLVFTKDQATSVALDALASMQIPRSDARRLLTLKPAQLQVAAVAAETKTPLAFQPVIDGSFMPHQTWTPGAPDESAHIPLLIGTNSDEAAAFLPDMRKPVVNDEDMQKRFHQSMGMSGIPDDQLRQLVKNYRQLLPKASSLEILVALSTDTWMWNSALKQAVRKCEQAKAPVYMYDFTWKTPCFGGMWALHGIEIPFVFGNLTYGVAWDGTDSEAARDAADPDNRRFVLAKDTMRAWTAFARTGNPSTPELPWAPYDLAGRKTMRLGVVSGVTADPNRDRRLLVQGLPMAW